ncbi:hypothetical protein F8568_043380 [Actinomadura sp. LD22]|uniref:Uncharacterized protein n=1 Tax=Actinomadura physcomitrii TaxID=2650748 RepID=A0A6I4MWL6_9ACTN|nr:hypothetical protein [Actinomadura physcomitrii]MWA07069.1 hypothetical protein [Actinomadura physcomitrii]
MAMDQEPTAGLDFWETLGVGEESGEQALPDPQDKRVAVAKTQQLQDKPPGVVAFEKGEMAPLPEDESAQAEPMLSPDPSQAFDDREAVTDVQPERAALLSSENTAAAVEDQESSQPPVRPAHARGPVVEGPGYPNPSPPPPKPDLSWESAARMAESIRPRLGQMWLDLLVQEAGGDEVMGRRVYHILDGQHLIGELWQDEGVAEIHVRGTRVTVCDKHGIREVPGFTETAVARRAVDAVEAAKDRMGAVVTHVGESVIVSRRDGTGLRATDLVTSGVVTNDHLAQVEKALAHMEAVTVVGPAARMVVHAFASLIPQGCRVFEGPYGVLPAGCVAAASPLDADYVIGVRPGAPAEPMAAAGQIGALIANPETEFRAAVRLVVSGRFASVQTVTQVDDPAVAASADG